MAGSETGLGAITGRIRYLSKQEEDLIASNKILTREYETESHSLSLITRSQDEIKRLFGFIGNSALQSVQ